MDRALQSLVWTGGREGYATKTRGKIPSNALMDKLCCNYIQVARESERGRETRDSSVSQQLLRSAGVGFVPYSILVYWCS